MYSIIKNALLTLLPCYKMHVIILIRILSNLFNITKLTEQAKLVDFLQCVTRTNTIRTIGLSCNVISFCSIYFMGIREAKKEETRREDTRNSVVWQEVVQNMKMVGTCWMSPLDDPVGKLIPNLGKRAQKK